MESVSKVVACLCLLLTVLSAAQAVAHHHSSQVEDSACRICVVAHSTIQTNISAASKPVFRTIRVLQLRPSVATKCETAFGLYVRPPPSV
jgi:hypothetical protein